MNMQPNLFRRAAATLIDLGVIFYGVRLIFQTPLILEPRAANLWAAIAFVLLYEPVLTAYLCTVGQSLMRTRVRHFETLEPLSLRKAYARFLMKYLVSGLGAAGSRGAVSLWPRGDQRALHDLQADSIVVTANAV